MTSNKFINAEIPVSNKHEAELAAKKAEELGYRCMEFLNYRERDDYLRLHGSGLYGFYTDLYGFYRDRDLTVKAIPLSDFLNQHQIETITLDNGEKWRVQLIEKVEEEPMSAEEFHNFHPVPANVWDWMERYAQYRLEFEREDE